MVNLRKFNDNKEEMICFFRRNYILLLVLCMGLALRLFDLTRKSLWWDEACSLSFAGYSWQDVFSHRYMAKPAYFFLLKPWVALFGNSEFSARFLAVIFGVLSILLIYKVAKELFDRETGLLSALFLSLSPYHIYFSQQVRNYTLFLLLGLLSMLIFIKILKKEKLILYILLVLVNILVIYALPFGVSIVIIQNIFFMILHKRMKAKKWWIISQFIIAISIFPLLLLFINDPLFPGGNDIFTIPQPNFRSLVETFEVFSYGGPRQGHGGIGFGTNPSRLIIPRILTAFLFCLFIFGLLTRQKTDQDKFSLLNCNSKNIFLALWVLFPVFGTYFLSIFVQHIYATRFFIVASVAFYIIIAKVILRIRDKRSRIRVISIIIIFSLFSLAVLYRPGSENDWRKIAVYVRAGLKEKDTVLLVPLEQVVPFWYYYHYEARHSLNKIDKFGKRNGAVWSRNFFIGSNLVLGIELISTSKSALRKIAKFKNKGSVVWLIISPYWADEELCRSIKAYFTENYDLRETKYFDYSGVEVIRYSLKVTDINGK